jgi:hypothetical protein
LGLSIIFKLDIYLKHGIGVSCHFFFLPPLAVIRLSPASSVTVNTQDKHSYGGFRCLALALDYPVLSLHSWNERSRRLLLSSSL